MPNIKSISTGSKVMANSKVGY